MASGKLAPHRNVAGTSANRQRPKSKRNFSHALAAILGSTLQYGSLRATMKDVQRMAAASRSWQQPSASRAEVRRDSAAPAALPSPSPTRNTARMIENVYTVAPSISESRRVQTTSAPSAVSPESAIAQ